MASLEHWCSLHADEWLAWRSLGALAKCSASLKRVVCYGGAQTVLDLSEGRLAWRRGPLRPIELRALQPVDDSETYDENPNLLTRIGLYLSESPVGRQLFKPEIFHLWPSPAAHIAGSLGSMWGHFHLGLFMTPASCVEDCSETWVTSTRVIYSQDGYCPQHLWKGVLELTTPSHWRRESKGVRLTLHLEHNLEYAIGKKGEGHGGHRGLHLRNVLTVLSLPRRLLGVSARRAWSARLLHITPSMPVRSGQESQLRRYCLDRWREVVVDRVDWVLQDSAAHDFARMALQDGDFPWDGTFGAIYTYMCISRAPEEVIGSFERTWNNAGLKSMAFCLDCRAFVDKEELTNYWNDEEVEEEVVHKKTKISVRSFGCYIESISPDVFCEKYPDVFCGKYHGNLQSVYGEGAKALFGHNCSWETIKLSERDRITAVWTYRADTNSWQLHEKKQHRHQEEMHVRWRKTCGGVTAASRHNHFPRACARTDAVTPAL